MSSCKVSVIIPAYNQGHYLKEAIQSVLTQDYTDYELIIIDDGSQDNTREVVDSFSDARIRYLYQSNKGLTAARNTGIGLASGQYISFLDSDDIFLPEKLTALVGLLESKSLVGFVFGNAYYMDENGQRLALMANSWLQNDTTQLLIGNPIHVGSVLVRLEWLENVGLFDEDNQACGDWDMWLRLAKNGCVMQYIDLPVSSYRVHSEQMTRSAKRMRKAMLDVLDKIFNANDLPDSWYPYRDQAYASAYLRSAARAYHANELIDARSDLDEALRLNPNLLESEGEKLANHFAGWANSPLVNDPVKYLNRIYGNLPDSAGILRRRRHYELGKISMQTAFTAFKRGDMTKARFYALRAFVYDPSWIKNFGAISVLFRSFLSFKQ